MTRGIAAGVKEPSCAGVGGAAAASQCLQLESCQLDQPLGNIEVFPHLSSAKPGFLFTCNLHKNGCILQYFRMKIDRSLLAIVKQIISPQATLIHKMFQMGTITYSFPLIFHSSTHHHFSSP